jgi:hypothetical protein
MKRTRHTQGILGVLALLLSHAALADAVLDWNEIALAQVVASGQIAPDATRSLTMVHVAMFDATDAIDRRYEPYAHKERAPANASVDAAVGSAAYAVLLGLFPDKASSIQSAYEAAMARIPDGASKTSGIEVGKKVGSECLQMRAKDGTGAPNTYTSQTAAGVYVPTTLPVSTEWPAVKPWVIGNAARFHPGPPPALNSPQWMQDFREIRDVGGRQSATRTAAQTETARFWMVTGPVSWNAVVRSFASSKTMSTVERARLFALANMAACDAYIAVFEAKYTYNFWRPITAIRRADIDGNDATEPDKTWQPLIETPMHPEYPCAHCITSAAVGAVLGGAFGKGAVAPIAMTSVAMPGITHRWTKISDYVDEVSNARVWAGVHYRSSTDVGRAMGAQIGQLAVATVLKPLP